jgi:hypothetical protein
VSEAFLLCVCAALKVGMHEYHHKEPILSTLSSCSSSSQLPVSRAQKPLKDATDDVVQDSRLHIREHYDKVPSSPIRSCPQSPLMLPGSSVNVFGGAHCLMQTSPTKNPARVQLAVPASAPVKSNAKQSDIIARRIDLTATNFSVVPDGISSDISPMVYSSAVRAATAATTASLPSTGMRHYQTVAGGSSGRAGAQKQPSPWYPWPDCPRPKLDAASQEMLLQTLMNDSMEQRRKTIMSGMGKTMQASGRSAQQPSAAGEVYKTIAKAGGAQLMNLPGTSGMTLHGRTVDNSKPSPNQSSSTSPKASSVSPQQRSLLSSQPSHAGPLYHLPLPPSTQYMPQSVSGPTVSRRLSMQDLVAPAAQRHTNLTAATVLSTSPNSYGQLSQVTGSSGMTAFAGRSQSHCEVGFPGAGAGAGRPSSG